jgi:cell division inhibitor SepF
MRFPIQVNQGAVKIITPRYFEDEQKIADELLAGRVVIIDFKHLDPAIKQRVVAFLEGTLFGIDGKMVVLREDVMLLLPHGALAEEEKPVSDLNIVRPAI